jgi:hypothetical protein
MKVTVQNNYMVTQKPGVVTFNTGAEIPLSALSLVNCTVNDIQMGRITQIAALTYSCQTPVITSESIATLALVYQQPTLTFTGIMKSNITYINLNRTVTMDTSTYTNVVYFRSGIKFFSLVLGDGISPLDSQLLVQITEDNDQFTNPVNTTIGTGYLTNVYNGLIQTNNLPIGLVRVRVLVNIGGSTLGAIYVPFSGYDYIIVVRTGIAITRVEPPMIPADYVPVSLQITTNPSFIYPSDSGRSSLFNYTCKYVIYGQSLARLISNTTFACSPAILNGNNIGLSVSIRASTELSLTVVKQVNSYSLLDAVKQYQLSNQVYAGQIPPPAGIVYLNMTISVDASVIPLIESPYLACKVVGGTLSPYIGNPYMIATVGATNTTVLCSIPQTNITRYGSLDIQVYYNNPDISTSFAVTNPFSFYFYQASATIARSVQTNPSQILIPYDSTDVILTVLLPDTRLPFSRYQQDTVLGMDTQSNLYLPIIYLCFYIQM